MADMWLYGPADEDEVLHTPQQYPTAAEAATYWIPAHRLPELKDKLDKLVRKAQRLGVGAIAYAIGEPVDRPYRRYIDRDTGETRYVLYEPPAPGSSPQQFAPDIVYFKFYPVTVTGTTPRIAGWSFVATLQHLTDDTGHTTNLLRVVPGFTEQLPAHYRHADASNCDHCCRRIRTRKDTYILRNDATGEYQQVGRSCTQDFLGGKNPHDVALYLEALFAALAAGSESEEGDFGGRTQESYAISEFLTQTAAAVRVKGWVSRGAARDNPSLDATADIVLEVLGPPPFGPQAHRQWRELVEEVKPNDTDKQLAETAREYARENLSTNPDLDDYEHNLYVALTQPLITRRLAGITASVIPYYLRHVQRMAERAARTESNWVGEAGERGEFIVTPLAVRPLESDWGTTYLHRFVTPEGNVLTWFASSNPEMEIGKEYRITATVKKHDEYKGHKQTVVTRVTVWTEFAIEQEKIRLEALAEKAAAKAAKAAVKEAAKAAREAKAAAKAAKAAAKASKAEGWGDAYDWGDGWGTQLRTRRVRDRNVRRFIGNAVDSCGTEDDRLLLAIALGEDPRDGLEAYVIAPTPTGGYVISIYCPDEGSEIDRFRVE